MIELLRREFIYLWYYIYIQLEQIGPYWLIGIVVGSVISVFGKQKIHKLFSIIQNKNLGLFGLIPASIIGIISPLCMYGTIPIAASFSKNGMRDDWLAAFMMSSILLNPQLILYSGALGKTAFAIRLVSCFLCGIIAGVLVNHFYRGKQFFNFTGFGNSINRDTDKNVIIRLIKNMGRNIKATSVYFLVGIVLSAFFQIHVPTHAFASIFGSQHGFGVMMAATIGVPIYFCGGGTIPLLVEWLKSGMSLGAAAAFMITGPATKITNIGALKIILGLKNFIFYLLYSFLFAIATGLFTDYLLKL